MNIYEVVFWGSHGDQPNKDTIYLVRASDYQAAAQEVLNNASPANHGGDSAPFAHAVYEIGTELSIGLVDHPRILRGPYFESAYNRGWKAWYRKIEGSRYTKEWHEEQPYSSSECSD